jgi:single-strand DNA-binding protein
MINKVILVGNVGRDPEIRHFDNNVAQARFSLATSETYSKNGERVTNTEWHNIVVWGPQAEIAQKYIRKGILLYVEGRLRSRSYDDKDGVKKYVTEIVCDNFRMLSRADGQNGGAASSPIQGAVSTGAEYSSPDTDFAPGAAPSDDLPF